ncbi:hypothetical protein AOQ84DRAFT_291652, partial [Glonium stellatum]
VKWDSLSEWLSYGDGCYWVNGKAGSGKPTLMKYLREGRRTTGALLRWAGTKRLVIETFFFWDAGTPLQKSKTGLLRSLLFDILRRRQKLIPVLFPGVCRSTISGQLRGPLELSFIELRKAFMTLMNSVQDNLGVCFIVDGIDEYEGDQDDLVELFSQATTSSSVKMLISSRPIPSCVFALLGSCSLRLQDLTFNDVKQYSEDSLGKHSLMQAELANPGATAQLISGITSKAMGVFLWVALVVRLLRQGLQEYGSISDLQRKLDELPPDLEKLYQHMLSSMSLSDRIQGSKLLQVVLRSTETHGNYPMTVLQLSFAEEGDYVRPFWSKISPIPTQEEIWRCEGTGGRMRS